MPPEGFKLLSGYPKYLLALEEFRKSLSKNLEDGNTDGIYVTSTKVAEATISFLGNFDNFSAYSGSKVEVASMSKAAREIIDTSYVLENSKIRQLKLLDDFDRLNLQVAQLNATIDMIEVVISFMGDKIMPQELIKTAQKMNVWVTKFKILKGLIADGVKSVYKDDLQTTYAKLLFNYERNQIAIEGLSKFLDKSAEEVGEYLIKARSDVITRQADGKIAVMTDEVLSPP